MDYRLKKTLIVVAGPTAVGKTAAAIALAQRLGTEIISADSRQFYKEMNIGVARPSPEELAAVKHHFIASHRITEGFSVGDFEQQGLALLNKLFKKHDYVLLAGGSGLYIKALCEGIDEMPAIDPGIREKLKADYETHGITYLQEKLKEVDPVYYNQVDLNNQQRLVRALEMFESTGMPFSAFRKSTVAERPFNIIKYGLTLPREQLYERINLRVDIMMNEGLLEEAKALLPYRHLNALNTVGYSELFDYFDGKTDLPTAVELIKRNTRHFAKRQMTWFRKDAQMQWIAPGELENVGL